MGQCPPVATGLYRKIENHWSIRTNFQGSHRPKQPHSKKEREP